MVRYPPRHLSQRRSDPALLPATTGGVASVLVRLVLLAVVVAAVVAAGLGARTLLGPASPRPPDVTVMRAPAAPTRSPAADAFALPTSTTTATARRSGVNLLPDPSFETGLAGWRAVGGTRLDRVGSARDGRWAANISQASAATPRVVAPRVAVVARKVPYVAALWLRSSRPGTAVRVQLVELRRGRRLAVDTVDTALDGVSWQRLEVAHDGHEVGNVLALEIEADLPGSASISLDQVDLRPKPNMASGAG
jgi:hypothetical protein